MKKSTDYQKLIVCIAALLFAIQPVFSQMPEITWEKSFEIRASHYFSDVLEKTDGSFILLGAIEMPGDKNFDIWLLECNSLGDTIKTKVFGFPGNDIPMKVVAYGENGFLIASINHSPETGFISRLIALDVDFKEMWSSSSDQPSALGHSDLAVDETGQVWWLNTFAGNGGKPAVSLWKLDSEGNKTAEFDLGDSNMQAGYAIRILPDGTLAVSCQVKAPDEKATVQIIRLNTEGNTIWKTTLPQTGKILTPQCLCCSPDNAMLVGGWAGLCYNPDAPEDEQIWDYDYLLTKIDAIGKVLWTQNYNREGSEKGTAIAILPDGNIMAAGKCETSFTGNIGPWLLFIDKNGKLVKDQVYKFRFVRDQAARIVCTSDGGLLMVGPGYIDTDQRLTGWVKKLSPVL